MRAQRAVTAHPFTQIPPFPAARPAGDRVSHATYPLSPLEECDARESKSRREGRDLARDNAAGRVVMNDTSSGGRDDTRLPVGEPYIRMAVECPALRVGNWEGDDSKGSSAMDIAWSEIVVRGRIELPTFRFSGGRSYQLSYLTGPDRCHRVAS
jgi:hypothetical protein